MQGRETSVTLAQGSVSAATSGVRAASAIASDWWRKELSDDVRCQRLADQLGQFVSGHLDVITTFGYCFEGTGLAVLMVAGHSVVRNQIAAIAQQYPGFIVPIVTVPRSSDELQALTDQLTPTVMASLHVTQVVGETLSGGLSIGVSDSAYVASTEAAVRQIIGPDVPLSVGVVPEETPWAATSG